VKETFSLGVISQRLGALWIIVMVAIFSLILFGLSYYRWLDSSQSCIECHGNKEKMEELEAPYFYMTQEQVEKETGHPGVQCRYCHLGNGRKDTPEEAHEGMLKLLLIGQDNSILPREYYYPKPFLPSGDDELRAFLPKTEFRGKLYPLYEVRNILYHDRNTETFGYDPKIAKKTCGQRNCHPDEVQQFSHTTMGANFRQRTMRTWLTPYGPHNCGPSFADTSPDGVADGDRFSKKNYLNIVDEINVPFSMSQAVDKQKICNICHAGCLDCHYSPSHKDGVHAFRKTPSSFSCSGGGRSSSICHPGTLERRRGDTYLGNDFSEPQGLPPDVHVEHDIECVDCHYQGNKGMGDQIRKATCQDCHIEIEEALAQSDHKNVTCSACHTGTVGGYQLTTWGPGKIAEKPNPFKKFSLYYGTLDLPIIIKDQKDEWISVKPIPHTVGNFKKEVKPSEKLLFRWPDGQTRDPYYVFGTFDGLPGNNLHLAWMEIQHVSHSLGKSRNCDSCHSEKQESHSQWRFFDNYGAEPFEGRQRVIADNKGMHVIDIENTTPIKPMDDSKLEDFAAWIFLKDIWHVPGDFSIKTDKEKYDNALEKDKKITSLLDKTENKISSQDKQTQERFKVMKGIVLHNPEKGKEIIDDFITTLKKK
jgi:hypothetical protein